MFVCILSILIVLYLERYHTLHPHSAHWWYAETEVFFN